MRWDTEQANNNTALVSRCSLLFHPCLAIATHLTPLPSASLLPSPNPPSCPPNPRLARTGNLLPFFHPSLRATGQGHAFRRCVFVSWLRPADRVELSLQGLLCHHVKQENKLYQLGSTRARINHNSSPFVCLETMTNAPRGGDALHAGRKTFSFLYILVLKSQFLFLLQKKGGGVVIKTNMLCKFLPVDFGE